MSGSTRNISRVGLIQKSSLLLLVVCLCHLEGVSCEREGRARGRGSAYIYSKQVQSHRQYHRESSSSSSFGGVKSYLQVSEGAGSSSGEAPSGHCEYCMKFVQQVQYGAMPVCNYTPRASAYASCYNVLESILKYSEDIMVLIKQGCYEFDSYKGWQTVTPCPAHVICGKLTIEKSQSGDTHCPTDFHYKFTDTIGHEKSAEGENPLLPYAIESYVQKRTISE